MNTVSLDNIPVRRLLLELQGIVVDYDIIRLGVRGFALDYLCQEGDACYIKVVDKEGSKLGVWFVVKLSDNGIGMEYIMYSEVLFPSLTAGENKE